MINQQFLKQLAIVVDSVEGAGLPYHSPSQAIHCSLITLLRDVVTGCSVGEGEGEKGGTLWCSTGNNISSLQIYSHHFIINY